MLDPSSSTSQPSAAEAGADVETEATAPLSIQAANEAPLADESTAPTPGAPETDTRTPERKAPSERESTRFAQLARKEGELVRRQEAIKKSQADLDAWQEVQELSKSSPLQALSKLGLSYDQLTELVLAAEQSEAAGVKEIRSEIEALKKSQAEREESARRAAEERLTAEREATVEQFRHDAVRFVESNADRYELTVANGGGTLVAQVIEGYFQSTSRFDEAGQLKTPGKLMSFEEAADHVERHFEEKAEKLLATKKLASKLKPAAPAPATAEQPKTLSNALSASTTAASPARLTEEERVQRAVAAMAAKAVRS